MVIGTVGELLVQLRLLEHDVQAAPPLKDSGNDLIAVRGKQFRSVQVKTTANGDIFEFNHKELKEKLYDILALVQLVGEGPNLRLDECGVYLIPKAIVQKGYYTTEELAEHKMCPDVVDALFAE
jgi:hypothetical protein